MVDITSKSYRSILEFFGYELNPNFSDTVAYHYFLMDNSVFIYVNKNGQLLSYLPVKNVSYSKFDLFLYLCDIVNYSDIDNVISSIGDEVELIPKSTTETQKLLGCHYRINPLVIPDYLTKINIELLSPSEFNLPLFSSDNNMVCTPLFNVEGFISDFLYFNQDSIKVKSNNPLNFWKSPISESDEIKQVVFSCNPFAIINYIQAYTPGNILLYLSSYNISDIQIKNINDLSLKYNCNSICISTAFYPQEYTYILNILRYYVNNFTVFKLNYTDFNDRIDISFTYSTENIKSDKVNSFLTSMNSNLRKQYNWTDPEISKYFSYYLRYNQFKILNELYSLDIFSIYKKPYLFYTFFEFFVKFIFDKKIISLLYVEDYPLNNTLDFDDLYN